MHYNLPLFIFAAIIGRSARFLLVSSLVRLGAIKLESKIEKYVEHIGWLVVLVVALFLGVKLLL